MFYRRNYLYKHYAKLSNLSHSLSNIYWYSLLLQALFARYQHKGFIFPVCDEQLWALAEWQVEMGFSHTPVTVLTGDVKRATCGRDVPENKWVTEHPLSAITTTACGLWWNDSISSALTFTHACLYIIPPKITSTSAKTRWFRLAH